MQAVKDKVSGMPALCSSSAQLPYGAAANIELDPGSNYRSNLDLGVARQHHLII